MGKEHPTKSFKSGNSVAIRMPAGLGVTPDGDWIAQWVDGEIHLRKVEKKQKKIDLTGIYGSLRGLSRMPVDDVERGWCGNTGNE